MGFEITGRQRDLLYEFVIDRLTGIDAVWLAVEAKEWEDAQCYGREFADLLLLLVEGLGWGAERSKPVTLAAPPDVLQRTLEAIRSDAVCESEEQRDLRLLVAETQLERQEALETCDELLAKLVDRPLHGTINHP